MLHRSELRSALAGEVTFLLDQSGICKGMCCGNLYQIPKSDLLTVLLPSVHNFEIALNRSVSSHYNQQTNVCSSSATYIVMSMSMRSLACGFLN